MQRNNDVSRLEERDAKKFSGPPTLRVTVEDETGGNEPLTLEGYGFLLAVQATGSMVAMTNGGLLDMETFAHTIFHGDETLARAIYDFIGAEIARKDGTNG